jgi:hypothetical protein
MSLIVRGISWDAQVGTCPLQGQEVKPYSSNRLLLIEILFFLPFFLLSGRTHAQLSPSQVSHINLQVQYLNESIHGHLIAHRLFENFNQEINKYMNQPSYAVRTFTNEDLPRDLFADDSGQFYKESPSLIYRRLLSHSERSSSPVQSWDIISTVRNISSFVNSARLEIGLIMGEESFDALSSVQKIYTGLENAVGYYDDLSMQVVSIETSLRDYYYSVDIPEKEKQVYTALLDLHFDIKKAVRQIRSGEMNEMENLISKVEKELNWLRVCIREISDPSYRGELTEVRSIIEKLTETMSEYLQNPSLPEEYAAYGIDYYFINVRLLTLVNRYGNGYVSKLNKFFASSQWPVLHFIEEPHYLKVLYPNKSAAEVSADPKEEDTFLTESDQPEESIEPAEPESYLLKNSHTIYVDSVFFFLELHDHREGDSDLISVNVNGKWLYTNISLQKEPLKLALEIKSNQDNSLYILAEDVGWKPPNTVGVSYYSKDPSRCVLLKDDLYPKEMIEIKYRIR